MILEEMKVITIRRRCKMKLPQLKVKFGGPGKMVADTYKMGKKL